MFIDCPNDSTKYDILCRLYGLMTIGQSVIFVKVLSRMGPFYTSKRLC
jgi:ATP-dependent RNA helicase DDX19/DBP5